MFILEEIKNYYANRSPICATLSTLIHDLRIEIRERVFGIDVSSRGKSILDKNRSRFYSKSLQLGDNYGNVEFQVYNYKSKKWSTIDGAPFEGFGIGEYNCFRIITYKNPNDIHELAYFELIRMFNFCADLVLTEVKGKEEYMSLVHKAAYDIAQWWGYTKLITTDFRSNHKWHLTMGGWKEISSFKNRRSGHIVYMCEKHIKLP